MHSSRLMKSNLTSATCGTEDSRGLSGRREVAPVNPGHRPSASALSELVHLECADCDPAAAARRATFLMEEDSNVDAI